MADTGFKSPTSNAAIGGGWTFPTYAYTDDAVYAYATSSNDRHSYADFSFGIPAGATIDGIEVQSQNNADGPVFNGDQGQISFALSKNNGSSYTSYKTITMDTQTGDYTNTFGGATDKWGTTWVDTDFADGTFRLEMRSGPTWTGGTAYINTDYILVKVYYTASGGGGGSVASTIVSTMRTLTGVGL
jgi:hypothetical protein